MKPQRRVPLIFLVWLLIACMIVPVWADEPTAEDTTATEPTLYFHIDFEDMAVGTVTSGTQTGTGNALWLGVNQNIAEYNGNKVLRTDKVAGSGSSANPDYVLFPFRAMGVANLSAYKADFVLSWDQFVSDDDGSDFNLVAGRSPDNSRKWGPSTFIQAADSEGKGHIVYWDANGTKKTSDGTVAYGQWNRIAIIVHPAEGDSEVTTFDIYVNSALMAEGVKIWFDTDRFTIGKLVNTGTTPADCYQMVDNIKCYSGSTLCTDAELGILPVGAQYAGVQFSAVKDEKYSLRLVGTLDSLAYQAVGFDVIATYTEGGTEKTKTVSKNAGSVYDSILATADGRIATYTAESLGGKYLYALILDGIPTAIGEVVLDVCTYSVTDGVKTVQSRVRLTVRDGSLVSSCYL